MRRRLMVDGLSDDDLALKTSVAAILVVASPLTYSQRAPLAELALKHRLPGMFGDRDDVEAGGLMSYGADINDLYRRAATSIKSSKAPNQPTCPWSRRLNTS